MGLTTQNVHVRLAGPADDQGLQRLRQAVNSLAEAGGLVACPESSRADRSIVISAGDGPWVAIHDSAFGESDAMAQSLSGSQAAVVVSINVFDSDDFALRLFDNGKAVDQLSNPRGKRKGKPARWGAALAAGRTVGALQSALEVESVFAEDTVAAIASELGINKRQCLSTLEDQLEANGGGLTIQLHFRVPSDDAAQSLAPTKLETRALLGPLDMGEGDRMERAWLSFANTGGASQGLSVILHGSAIDEGLIEWESASAHSGQAPAQPTPIAPMVAEGVLRADFPALDIPAGIPADEFRKRLIRGNAKNLFQLGVVSVLLSLRAVRQGAGELRLTFSPHANPTDGATGVTLPVTVTAPPRRPLRAGPPSPQLTDICRRMETPDALSCLVALSVDKPAAASIARAAIERWLEVVPPGQRWQFITAEKPMAEPKEFRVAAKDVPKGKRWRDALDRLGSLKHLQASLDPDERGYEGVGGFLFDVNSQYFVMCDEKPAPHLALWLNLKRADEKQAAAASALLEQVLDDIFSQGAGLQAMIVRWKEPIAESGGGSYYETACGINGQVVTASSWCSRFLRGVSERLWLGPAMLASLGSRDSLGEVAEVTPIGDSLQVKLRREASLDDLEKALEPLLPTVEQWTEAVKGLYKKPGGLLTSLFAGLLRR